MKKGLLIIPYAFEEGFNVGVNINKKIESRDIYLKNCCVASISAKRKCGIDTDVAIVSNIDIPDPYNSLLKSQMVKIINYPFDEFNFGANYRWSLAFYKLCALSKVVSNLKYDYYAYLDSDVYVQDSFDSIWDECNHNILMYDINHSLLNADYCRLMDEIKTFDTRITGGVTHYGGEFYASNANNARMFLAECRTIYRKMIEKGVKTRHGDEFITTLAAHYHRHCIKNAGPYVYRYWTGDFRLISTNYKFNPVVVLHCPSEKENGMLIIYNKYIKKGKIPAANTVFKLLNLSSPSFKYRLKYIVSKTLSFLRL